MQFNAAQLLKEPIGSERAYSLAEHLATLGPDQPSRVKGEVRLTRTDKGIWVHALLSVTVAIACSRCLKSSEQQVAFELDEEYLLQVDTATGVPTGNSESEDDAFTLDKRHRLDLREAVRQYSLAQLPMKPLCRSDCQGLCPRCGADLNEHPCACPRNAGDRQRAVLGAIAFKKASV